MEKVTDLTYLSDTMGGNKRLINEIIEVFLKQAPEELSNLNKAVDNTDYGVIKGLAHIMKSSASIMGISTLSSKLKEMEEIARNYGSIEKIKELNNEIHFILTTAISEIEIEKIKYN